MLSPLILKLEHGAALTVEDRAQLHELTVHTRQVPARRDLIREGELPGDAHLIISGFACRYKAVPGNRRQIMAYLLPGDFCEVHAGLVREMDHSVATLSPCTVADVPRATLEDIRANHPRIDQAFWWSTLVDQGTSREWLVNLGQRRASQRVAHLFCELMVRMSAVGLVCDNSFELPVTQMELADTLGLSTVHVNRVLQQLRDGGFIVTHGRTLKVLDLIRLMRFAEFKPNYLHLGTSNGH